VENEKISGGKMHFPSRYFLSFSLRPWGFLSVLLISMRKEVCETSFPHRIPGAGTMSLPGG
jgi:hypothetical protein